jgi:serine/threonine protein kinase
VAHFEDLHFIVMRRLDGVTLSTHMKRRGKMPLSDAANICRQLCDALAHLHSSGFVHRDVKPSNAFIDAKGHVTLLDMGITRHVAQALTQPAMIFGSFQYMAPEQALSPADVDARADVYALGLVLFELVLGRPAVPLNPAPMAMVRAHLETPVADSMLLAQAPAAVAAVIRKAVARNREARYRQVSDLKRALDSAIAAEAKYSTIKEDVATVRLSPLSDETILERRELKTDAFRELQTPPQGGPPEFVDRDAKPTIHSSVGVLPVTSKNVGAVQRAVESPVPQRPVTEQRVTEPNGIVPLGLSTSSRQTEPFSVESSQTQASFAGRWLIVGLLATVAAAGASAWFAFFR